MKRMAVFALAAFALAACGRNEQVAQIPQPQVIQQPAPVAAGGQPIIVNNTPAQSGGGVGDMIMGGAIGYMLGSSRGGSAAPAYTERNVTHVTNVTKNYHVTEAPKPAAPAAAPAPAPVAAAPAKPSYAPTYANKPAAAAPTVSYSPSYAARSSSSSSSYSSMSRSSGRR